MKIYAQALLCSIPILMAGCLAGSMTPVTGVPINIEDRGYYKLNGSAVHYRDGTMYVSGYFSLSPGTVPPRFAHFHVQFLDASGNVLADIPARLEQDDFNHGPSDMQQRAAFKVNAKVPLDQVKRIEAIYDVDSHPDGQR